jgi:hypothetical protein
LPRDTPANEIKRLPTYLRVTLKPVEGLTFIVVDENEPTGAGADLPWLRIDGAGRPVGLFIKYNGNYVKVYDAGVNELRYFQGSNTYPQAPWYFCDGTNGTPDLRTRMVKADGTTGDPATAASYLMGIMQYKGYL